MRRLLLKFGLGWIGGQIRAMAEGKLGPEPKRLYWWLAGKKTITGVLLGCLASVAAGLGHETLATVTATLASVLLSAGLADKGWRSDVPMEFREWAPYRLLRDRGPDVAAGLGALSLWVTTCSSETSATLATWRLTCGGAARLLVVVSAVLFQLGLIAEAKLSPPPRTG